MVKNHVSRIGIAILFAVCFLPLSVCYCQPGAWHNRFRGIHQRQNNNPGPMSPDEIRKILEQAGGEIVSLPNGYFFLQWFPENWNSLKIRHIVITLHGNGGHAERMFNLWYRNRSSHDFAIIALQYAISDEYGNLKFQDSHEIYQNLRLIIDHLKKDHFFNSKTALILHGFSRGSARIFELAAMDRAADGMHAFSAFIADSGTSFAENRGRISPFLEKLSPDAYKGARFWLYCGSGDRGGRLRIGMLKMKKFITEHGGKVDNIFIYDTNKHGIFITGGPGRESRALNTLFAYINGIRPITDTSKEKR